VYSIALILANSIGCNNIQVEVWNEATTIFIECFELKEKIRSVEFTHCKKREANEAAAHVIARILFFHINMILIGSTLSLARLWTM